MSIELQANIYRPVINAGQPLTQDIAGRHFYYINGSSPILVKLGNMSASLLRPGQGIGPLVSPDEFQRIEITNPAGTRMEVSFWAGYAPFIDNRQDQVEARTEFVPVADVPGVFEAGVLLPGQSLDLAGSPTESRYRRKAVVIGNLDPSPAVLILMTDAADQIGGIVRGGESITHPISGFVRFRNTSASGIACHFSEIWWNV